MKINDKNIVFDSEASIRIERPWGSSDYIVVLSQGPRGNATHIVLTPEEAHAVLDLLKRQLCTQGDEQ